MKLNFLEKFQNKIEKGVKGVVLLSLINFSVSNTAKSAGIENLEQDPTKVKTESPAVSSSVESKNAEIEYLQARYAQVDSTIVEEMKQQNNIENTPKINFFGFKQLDSLARANGMNIYLNLELDMEAFNKVLDQESFIKGKKIKEVLDKYVVCVGPKTNVPGIHNGAGLNYEEILQLFGIKKIDGSNIGNQERIAQNKRLDFEIGFFPISSVFDSLSANEQASEVRKSTSHDLAKYNETVFKYLALKTINPGSFEKLVKDGIIGRVSEICEMPSGKSFAGYSLDPEPNLYGIQLKKNSIATVGIANNAKMKGLGMEVVSRVQFRNQNR